MLQPVRSRRALFAGAAAVAVGVVATPEPAQAAGVTSVAGRVGDVVLNVADISGAARKSATAWDVTDPAFGALGNGTANDTAPIQAALNAAGAAGGGTVVLPTGTYKVSAAITVPAGVTLAGFGKYGSIIATSHATATVLTLGNASQLADLQIKASVTRTGGAFVDIRGNAAVVDNCLMYNYYIGVSVGLWGTIQAVGARISDVTFAGPAVQNGAGAIQFLHYSNFLVRGCVITGPDTGTQPTFGIRIRNGDTGYITDTNVTHHGRALYMDVPSQQNSYATRVTSSLFDWGGHAADGNDVSSAEITPAGGVWDLQFANCWFGTSQNRSGAFVTTFGTGKVDGVSFTGCEFVDNHDVGLLCVGPDVKNWQVTGGFSAGNGSYGVRAASGCGSFTISGHRAGDTAGRGANLIGINIDAGPANEYVIVGNSLTGNTAAGIYDGGTGTTKVVANNLG